MNGHTFCQAGHVALSASGAPLRFERTTSCFRACWNPMHFSTGCDGYFGNRLSVPDFLHSRNCDPLPETTSLAWTQNSQRLGIIGGTCESLSTCWHYDFALPKLGIATMTSIAVTDGPSREFDGC